jgi:hypothetical protein
VVRALVAPIPDLRREAHGFLPFFCGQQPKRQVVKYINTLIKKSQ